MNILIIPDILPIDLVDQARALLDKADWDDGATTASGAAREVKKNLQAKWSSDLEQIQNRIVAAVQANAIFRHNTFMAKMSRPLFNKYDVGMGYGDHFDNPVMGGQLRTDLSMTIFLSDPASYAGGELCIGAGGDQVKLEAGDAAVYPATAIHSVAPVSAGTRLAAVLWIQSMIRDHEKRATIAELGALCSWAQEVSPGGPETLRLGQLRANLLRRWMD